MQKKIYLAGPLFSMAEIEFNLKLYKYFSEKGIDVFLPQKECEEKDLESIFGICRSGIEQSSIVVAILDGADADSGTCWECGYAFALNKPIVAVRTDFRQSGDTRGFNAMLYYSASKIVELVDDYPASIFKAVNELFLAL